MTFAFICCLIPLGTSGQTAEELRAQISARNAEIEKLNKEIGAYEKQLTDVGAKKQTLQSTLQSLDISRRQITKKVDVTKLNIAALQEEIRELNGSISDKEGKIDVGKKGLSQILTNLDEVDRETLVIQILGNGSLSDTWDDLDARATFNDALGEHIEELAVVKAELEENKGISEEKRSALEDQRKKLVSEQTALDINRREQQSLLNATKSQESTYQKILAEKKAAREQFEQALNELESKLEYTLDPTRLPPAGRGVLRWPLDSVKITQNFGNTDFARSGAYAGKGHNGIDFRATVGTPIKAALSGRVVGVGNTDAVRGCYSYGKWILIQHQNGLSTLYAHLSHVARTEGESITTGEIIGYSGSTGYATGPHLHFTVYATNGVRVMKLGDSTGRKSPCANATIPVSPLGAYLNPLDYL